MGDFEDLTALQNFFNKNLSSAHNESSEEYEEFHYLSCAGFSYPYNDDEDEDDEEYDDVFAEECESASGAEVINTEEEIIDACNDEELKELLRLNRRKNAYLLTIYKSCKDALTKCQADIASIHSSNSKEKKKTHFTECTYPKLWKSGKPYFKTEDFYPCPPNQDTLIKFKNKELNICDLLLPAAIKWSETDAVRLLKWVTFQSKIKKKAELLAKIETTGDSKELQVQLSRLQDTNYIPSINCDSIDWTRISEVLFERKYTSDECRIYWNISVNPNINKTAWVDEEIENLKSLVVKHNYQNWDLIANELGTNRTGYTVFLNYSSKIAPPFQSGRFSKEEDKKLADLVEKYKTGNSIKWTTISRNFPNRTKPQLFFRYKYYLNCKSTISKERFSEAEDALILILVNRLGNKFTKCAEFMPNRSANQIKSRYSNICNISNVGLNKNAFTPAEDVEIFCYVTKNGTNNWKDLATKLKRARNQIQQRYQTLKRFLDSNPDGDIRNAPRKQFKKADTEDRYRYIKYVAQKFSNSNQIPTLEEIENVMRENPQKAVILSSSVSGVKRKATDPTSLDNEKNPGFNIDDLIVDFFSTPKTAGSILLENTYNKEISTVAVAVYNVLSTLNAHLLIPTHNGIAENEQLDEIDRKILKLLTQNRFVTLNAEFEIKSINSNFPVMPPNLNTLIGMRNILIRHEVFKQSYGQISKNQSQFCKSELEKPVSWSLETHLALQNEETQEKLLKERDLFTKRLFLLLKFPAMMSLIEPPVILVPNNSTVPEKKETKSVRTYQRKPKIQKIVDK